MNLPDSLIDSASAAQSLREALRINPTYTEAMLALASIYESTGDFETLNTRVYGELFLTPRSDEWLGLLPDDAFTGLDDDGIFTE